MVQLRTITDDNFTECIQLKVAENQTEFVAQNIYSLAQAYVAMSNQTGLPMPFAIYADEQMVGFVMLDYGQLNDHDPDDKPVYEIWRFMIDRKFQTRGYGRQAMIRILEFIRTFPHGPAELVILSYHPDNLIAKKLYASFGFQETGEKVDDELCAVLSLTDHKS